jgi:hypothetical protein
MYDYPFDAKVKDTAKPLEVQSTATARSLPFRLACRDGASAYIIVLRGEA